MTDHRDILDRLRDAEGVHGPTGIGELFRAAIAAIEQRDQTIANLLDEKRRAMAAAGDLPQPERWIVMRVPDTGRIMESEDEPFAAGNGLIWFRRRVTP
jgi:hypothetical protein